MDVSQLKRVPLFADVPEESLKKIAPFTKVDEFAEGVAVMREGGFSNDFYVIEEGTGVVTRDGEKIAEVGPGDVIGEEGLLEKSQRSATITATSEGKSATAVVTVHDASVYAVRVAPRALTVVAGDTVALHGEARDAQAIDALVERLEGKGFRVERAELD